MSDQVSGHLEQNPPSTPNANAMQERSSEDNHEDCENVDEVAERDSDEDPPTPPALQQELEFDIPDSSKTGRTTMPTTTPASPQPTLHIADAELDVSTQVDRLTQLQARLGPNRQQVDEDKLVIILRRYQWDVGQALSFFRLWCLLGSPPIDYDETQGYVEPWDDNARTDTEPFTQDEDPSDDQTGDRRNIEEGMPDLQVADPNTSATYPAQPHHSRGESVTLSESEQIFEADTQEVIDRSMAEYEENMQKIVHGTQEMSVTEPDEPEGGLSPNLRAAVRDARLKKQAGTNDNDTPESSKEQERRRKAQEEKRRKLKALGELFGGNTTDARSTKPKPLEQGGGSAKQLSKTTENRPPAEEIVPRSPQAGLPPRPIGTMGDDQGQRPSNHGSDAVSSSAVEGPDQVPSTTSSTQSPPTVSNDRSRPTRNDKPDVSKCDKTPKVSNNKSDYSPTRPRPKSTPYTQEELDVPAVALILQNTPQRPLPFSESVEVARLIREAREAAQTTAIATTAVTNEPPSSHNDADSNNSQAEHDVIPSSEGPDGDGDKQRDNSDSAQSAADEIDESKGGERSDDREAAPNSGQDGSGGDGDGDRDTDDDQPRDQDNASKSSTSSDDSSDNEEGQDADSHNGPGTESVSQNIEGGSNPNETQGAPEQSEKSRGAPEPPTTTPANPQSQLSPAEQQTQLAEFARRVSPATLTQNELRFLLQFRRWNMDAAVEMVPSFLSRKRERERREREEAERRRQIAIEAAKTSAEDADGVENADQNDEENREDENDRSWEDYIRRHEGEAALSGGTRSVEESNQHHDQSQENDHAIAVAIDAEQAESDGQVESQDDRDFVDAGPRIGQEAALTPSQSELIDDMILRMHLEESAGAYTNQETAMADSPNDGDEGREKGEDCEDAVPAGSAETSTTDDKSRGPSPNAEVKKMIDRMKNLPSGKKPPPKPTKEQEEQRRRQEARRKVFEAQSELQRRDGNTINPQPTSTEPTNQGDESVRAGEREHLEGSGGELDAQIDQDGTPPAAAEASEEGLDRAKEPEEGDDGMMAVTEASEDGEFDMERMPLEKSKRRGG